MLHFQTDFCTLQYFQTAWRQDKCGKEHFLVLPKVKYAHNMQSGKQIWALQVIFSHLKIQRKEKKPQWDEFWPQTRAFHYTLCVYDMVPACCVNTTPFKCMADVTQALCLQKSRTLSRAPVCLRTTVNSPIQILIFSLRHYEKSLDTVIQIRTTSGSADRVSFFQNHA